MTKLRTEQNTPKITDEILEAAKCNFLGTHPPNRLSVDFEHDQHWVTCLDCGAQWSAIDAVPGPYSFEQVTQGDDSCPQEDDDEEPGDDLCDVGSHSGVNVERTTYCGQTIGIECGYDATNDGTCGDPNCEECKKGKEQEAK